MGMLNSMKANLMIRSYRITTCNLPSYNSVTPCTVGNPMEGGKELCFAYTQPTLVGQPVHRHGASHARVPRGLDDLSVKHHYLSGCQIRYCLALSLAKRDHVCKHYVIITIYFSSIQALPQLGRNEMELPGLRATRLRRLMTQDDLADATGMTKASISRLETGATKARVSTVRRLIAALSVESDQLTTTSEPTDGVSKGGEQR